MHRGGRFGLFVKTRGDRKSTRLNSSHQIISYAVFCLKKKNHYYHLNNSWTTTRAPETQVSRRPTTSTASIDIMGAQSAYANLHTEPERDSFIYMHHHP